MIIDDTELTKGMVSFLVRRLDDGKYLVGLLKGSEGYIQIALDTLDEVTRYERQSTKEYFTKIDEPCSALTKDEIDKAMKEEAKPREKKESEDETI